MTDELTLLRAVAEAALRHFDNETCTHEDTHRGGFLWTICDGCGKKWADDEGGFVPYSDPPAIANLRAALDAQPAAVVGETVRQVAAYQTNVHAWMLACFGSVIAADETERCHRFVEEAIELSQSCGGTRGDAHKLVDYVYGRDTGERAQEVGGVMVTLAALCNAFNIDLDNAAAVELGRCWQNIERIRAKQAAKPIRSPLPIPATVEPGA